MAVSSIAAQSIGILGYGETVYKKKSDSTLIALLADAARRALASAGLTKNDIDGIAVCSFELPPDNAVTLAEQFGISVSWAYLGTAGGAGPVASVINAIRAVEAGDAKTVLCLAADNYDVGGHFKLMDYFNKALINYGTPNGFGGANGLFGIIQRKHMETYGTRREDLGRIAVGQRASARLNENALLRGPLSIEDYMNARIIADPIRLYDCVLPCPGAEAVVVGALDRAPRGKAVKVLSGYERHNHPAGEIAPLRGGWELFRDRLWGDAGFGPADMQFVQAYDDYPIMVAIQLEDLGFCAKGEVSRFLAERTMQFDGSFPVNTNGGQLSCGQAGAAGGMIGLVEAVRQLRGEAGAFQTPGACRGVVSGYGMVGYGHGLSTSAVVLETAE
ncbi:acetyl-CoA acetyltransferase [Rhodoligotrophos appendicifer]|uniref:thiolase family protein n=1 Tax=Rhodoligotrophos appendicifer TaxID=987056 RepID=UPI00118009D9|nr:thiolase family protein [Rhodoligotrophos appendicifer]